MNKGISIIVCCYNSRNRLPNTLDHLAKLCIHSGLSVELLLVDNASTDDTASYVNTKWEELGNPFPIKQIYEQQPGLSFARQAGVKAAQYDLTLFCDDDNWLKADYLEVTATIMANPTIGICFGKSIPHYIEKPADWFYEFEEALALGLKNQESGLINPPKVPWGAGMVLRTSFIQSLWGSGFQSKLSDRKGASLSSGGDTEIAYEARKEGFMWWYENKLVLTHEIPKGRTTFSYLKKLYKGFGAAQAIIRKYYTQNPLPYEAKPNLAYIDIVQNTLLAAVPWKSKGEKLSHIRKAAFFQALIEDCKNPRDSS